MYLYRFTFSNVLDLAEGYGAKGTKKNTLPNNGYVYFKNNEYVVWLKQSLGKFRKTSFNSSFRYWIKESPMVYCWIRFHPISCVSSIPEPWKYNITSNHKPLEIPYL